MWIALKQRWRRFCYCCIACGRPLEGHDHSVYRRTYPDLCHRCGKRTAFVQVYGGPVVLKKDQA